LDRCPRPPSTIIVFGPRLLFLDPSLSGHFHSRYFSELRFLPVASCASGRASRCNAPRFLLFSSSPQNDPFPKARHRRALCKVGNRFFTFSDAVFRSLPILGALYFGVVTRRASRFPSASRQRPQTAKTTKGFFALKASPFAPSLAVVPGAPSWRWNEFCLHPWPPLGPRPDTTVWALYPPSFPVRLPQPNLIGPHPDQRLTFFYSLSMNDFFSTPRVCIPASPRVFEGVHA